MDPCSHYFMPEWYAFFILPAG